MTRDWNAARKSLGWIVALFALATAFGYYFDRWWILQLYVVASVVTLLAVFYIRWRFPADRSPKTLPFVLLVLALAASQSAAAAPDLASSVAGVAVSLDGPAETKMTAVPHASGAWGTDYLTVAHGMRSGNRYQVTLDGKQFDAALPVAAHRDRPRIPWSDPADLNIGDELQVLPWRGLHGPRAVRLLDHSFRHWIGGSEDWPTELDHSLVAEGRVDHGASGAPWVRHGRVYGIHKGAARIMASERSGSERVVAVADSVTRIKDCLDRMGYRAPE